MRSVIMDIMILERRAEEEREKLQTEMDELSAARPQQGAHLQAGRGPHRILAETLRKQVITSSFSFIRTFILIHFPLPSIT